MQNAKLHDILTEAIDRVRSADISDGDVSMLEIAMSGLFGDFASAEMPEGLDVDADGIPAKAAEALDNVQKLIKAVKYMGGDYGLCRELRDQLEVFADELDDWVRINFGNPDEQTDLKLD